MPRVVVVDRGDVVVRRPDNDHKRPLRSRSPVHFIRRQLSRRGFNLPLTNTTNTNTNTNHRPIIRRASLAFVKQKLWLHPSERNMADRSDIIFEQHEDNMRGELRRRKTEGDLRKRARFAEDRSMSRERRGVRKSKISRPVMERPTVPRVDTGLREQYQRRQERWERSDGLADSHVRRRTKRQRSPAGEHAKKARLSLSQLRQLSVSILQHEWPGKPGRPIEGKKFTKPMPEEQVKQMLDATGVSPEDVAEIAMKRLENQRWSYGSRAEGLEPLHPVRPPTPKDSPRFKHIRIAMPSPAKTAARPVAPSTADRARQLGSSSSTSQLTQRSPDSFQQVRKYSSVRELRSDRGPDPYRGVYRSENARPPRTRPANEEQRGIHPLLRTYPPRADIVASDISNPVVYRNTAASRSADEVELILSYNRPETMLQTPPVLDVAAEQQSPRARSSSSSSRNAVPTSPPASGIPGRVITRSNFASELEQKIFLDGLNSTRAIANATKLVLDPFLMLRAQHWTEQELGPPLPPKDEDLRRSRLRAHKRNVATKVIPVPGRPATRLVSAPSMSPMSCVEGWASGKYLRHKTVAAGELPGEHRYSKLPIFTDGRRSATGSRASRMTTQSRCPGLVGPCLCLEHDAWKVVVDPKWTAIGIGKAKDGRWIVEFVAGSKGGKL